jgi:translation initiation factor IF-2
MNISKLARQLKTEPQILREILPSLGIDIGAKAIQIDEALIPKVKSAWKLYQRREALKQKLAARKQKQPPSEPKQEIEKQVIKIPPQLTVSEFAKKLGIDIAKVITKLMQEGVMAAMNQKIDYETAHIVAEDFGIATELGEQEDKDQKFSPKVEAVLSKEKNLKPRPPVVVVMGHVDHGKTTLLDTIRKTSVVANESGDITQHIGAYQVKVREPAIYQGKTITFIDTPGHQAFRGMRSRGGQVADIAVLVIAGDDKIQPQTLESIEIIQKQGLSMVVAINKIDKPEADIDKIKKQLSEINLTPEDWGGEIICVPISAKQNQNINELLENILLLTEVEELAANPEGQLFATIIEAHVDKGLGPVVMAIVQNGTVRQGDLIKCENFAGRIRGMLDFQGHKIGQAGPSTPVKLLGLKCLPQVGAVIQEVGSLEKIKKMVKKHRITLAEPETKGKKLKNKLQIKIYLKTDVMGTLEALIGEINKIKHQMADIKVVKQGLGNFTETDALEAEAQGAVLIGFKVAATTGAREVKYKTYSVIYKLLDDLRNSLEDLIPPRIVEENIGQAKVLAIFSKTSDYQIIGGNVVEGIIQPQAKFRIFRNDEVMGEGSVIQLQSNKQIVKKVKAPQEFGLKTRGDLIIKQGDELRFYTTREEKRKL